MVSRFTALTVAGLLAPSSLWGQTALREGSVQPLDITVSLEGNSTNIPSIWSHTEQRLGARYVRLRFSQIKDQTQFNYEVLVRNRNGAIVQSFTKAQFGSDEDFWTTVIDGDYARVEIVAKAPPAGLSFKLSEIAYQQNMGARFSITLPDDREPIVNWRDTPEVYGPSHSVAKLVFIDGGASASCTGFLLSDDLMITNEHCIRNASVCQKTAIAIFNYEVNESGNLNASEKYQCADLVKSNHALDASLLRLVGKPGAHWGHLQLSSRAPVLGEQSFLVQHAGGDPKQISAKRCFVTTAVADGYDKDTDFGHKCNTLEGSSGSLLLGSDVTVIGLHHFGFDSQSQDQKWRNENRAVLAGRIKKWVTSLGIL